MLNQNPRETPSRRSSLNQWSVQHGRDLRQAQGGPTGDEEEPRAPGTGVRRIGAARRPHPHGGRKTLVAIGPGTSGSGSFDVTNQSTDGRKISRVRLDLTGAILPDVAFDPNGAAGDTGGKPFTVDGTTPVGLVGHALSGPHDGGYDALEINFNGFDPGETFNFSIDVDPTSIRGVAPPGPEDVGNITGLELTGTQVTVTFDDGTVWSDNLFRTPGSPNFSQSILRSGAPAGRGSAWSA